MKPILSPVSRYKGSRIARQVETSNAESPTPVYIYNLIFWQRMIKSFEVSEICIWYTSWDVLCCFVLDLSLNLRDSYSVKTKAYKNALLTYVCLPNLCPLGFRYGNRQCKCTIISRNTRFFIKKCSFSIKKYFYLFCVGKLFNKIVFDLKQNRCLYFSLIIRKNRNRRMRNRMYGGVRGRKTKVGRKLLRFPPTRSSSQI